MSTENTIVEGGFPDTPHQILLAGTPLEIPPNAQILSIDERTKFLLYARGFTREEFQVINNPSYDSVHPSDLFNILRSIPGGWPLKKFEQNINWIFDAQRSFTTRDGRIYVGVTYFHPQWRWYLNAVPSILDNCRRIFEEEITEEQYNMHPFRMW